MKYDTRQQQYRPYVCNQIFYSHFLTPCNVYELAGISITRGELPMRRRKQNKKSSVKKWLDQFDIPEDVVLDIPRITLLDNTEMRVENYKAILEYEESGIKLACKEKLIQIHGEKLNITVITDDEISISGTITGFSFA